MRIAAFAGFYGDRASGIDESLRSQPDVIIGDYLAELTLLVMKKNMDRGRPGYAEGFVRDLAPYLTDIEARGVKVVTNAGGLEPEACARALRDRIEASGLSLRVAWISGDNVLEFLKESWLRGEDPVFDLDSGEPFRGDPESVLTANAYLGCWPIKRALDRGADIVVCPRVTDASLVMGPAAWHFEWRQDDWNSLAGALAAGHLIECGPQVSGGNFSFFYEHEYLGIPGMPYVDIEADGSFLVGKAPGTGGLITLDTVTAQLLYEMGGRYYQNPDVILDMQSLKISQVAADLVRVSGAVGIEPTSSTKVSLCFEGGYRNTMTVALTGRNVEAKVRWIRRIVEDEIEGQRPFERIEMTQIGPSGIGSRSYSENTSLVVISVRDSDAKRVGRQGFSQFITSLGVSSIPGFYTLTPPQSERRYGIQSPCLLAKSSIHAAVHINCGDSEPVGWGPSSGMTPSIHVVPVEPFATTETDSATDDVDSIAVPFSRLFGTRSGDKGGMANLGVWARDEGSWLWLRQWLSIERLAGMLPELREARLERHVFPNLRALNFLAFGFLWEGASACLRLDGQAKGLGEYLGAQEIQVPRKILA